MTYSLELNSHQLGDSYLNVSCVVVTKNDSVPCVLFLCVLKERFITLLHFKIQPFFCLILFYFLFYF